MRCVGTLRLFGDRRAGCLILDCSIHPLFLMYSAVNASSRASGAPKTTNKTTRLPSAVSGGNKAPWRLGTPYGAKSAPPREWYPTSVQASGSQVATQTPKSPGRGFLIPGLASAREVKSINQSIFSCKGPIFCKKPRKECKIGAISEAKRYASVRSVRKSRVWLVLVKI